MIRRCRRLLAPFNFSRDVFDVHAQRSPQKLAWWRVFSGGEEKKTFAEISQDSKRVAQALHNQGIKKGDTIIVVLPKVYEWWLLQLASLRLGVIMSPGTTLLTKLDQEYRVEQAKAKLLIGDALAKSKGAAVPFWEVGSESWKKSVTNEGSDFPFVETDEKDIALAFFTSGTTGKPKIAVHTMESYGRGHVTTAKWLDLKADDVHWNMSDLGWVKAGWSSFFAPWNVGCAVFVHDFPFHAKTSMDVMDQ